MFRLRGVGGGGSRIVGGELADDCCPGSGGSR